MQLQAKDIPLGKTEIVK